VCIEAGEDSGDRLDGLATVEPDHPWPVLSRAVKRGLDLLLASAGLLLTLPIVLLSVLAVKCDTRGPAFFRQVRVGANGRRFRMVKIRTMLHDNDDSQHRAYMAALVAGAGERCGGMYKLVDDPRVTRVGRVLRRFSLDEIPQIWNVLKGDMSVVGPRPPLPSEVELYQPRAMERLRVKPGMTGLWQVSGRCRLPFEAMVELDVAYWQRWSLLLDLAILLRTPKAVLAGAGAA
jgi:lipopolysaccharide/colanic/teichoic acid biosynthesis glycosyltransferase